ncbi:37S ribosomal protein S7, mitochondrial [Elsinoe australis]|uniref:Small ribosomal subunit protein uS7m n=1 Tax=Elsinoe australis TaxID=40998 RepID=A0A2P7Z3E3_9PEZI|nr:37S ribosomal protein S7, mitochondrial [Elsinoe australis]
MSGITPRLYLFSASRRLAFRPRAAQNTSPFVGRQAAIRHASGSKPGQEFPVAEVSEGKGAVGPNMNQQEHVSEEAAKMANITGGEGPDLSQGTPVQDILKEDKEAQKDAPQVMKDSIKSKQTPPKPQSRPFSTYARRQQDMQMHNEPGAPPPEFLQQNNQASAFTDLSETTYLQESTPAEEGVKFGMPDLPIPARNHKDYRYDPVVDQVTNLMMQHGEKAKAQRNMSNILQFLRTSPPPTYNPQRPLMPGAPPANHLPLHPVLYLTLALDSLAPLLRIRSQRGAAGGGAALQIPVPLSVRQRRRQAFKWILDSASKKTNKGTGKFDFSRRIADEIVAVVEGKSALWDRRTSVHKVATTARSNLGFGMRKGRR